MDSNIRDTVFKIIANQVKKLSIEDIKDTSSLMLLGADSLDAVEIILDLESTYNLSISEEDFEKLHTVADIILFIESKIA